jgi:hypothetical protein
LERVLKYKKIGFLVLTGATAVDARQSLVDEFSDDETKEVFLLSTKAGGMGINLTAASVVIMCVFPSNLVASHTSNDNLIMAIGLTKTSILIMTSRHKTGHTVSDRSVT